MKTNIEISAGRCTLKVSGRFDQETILVFRNASRKLLADCPAGQVVVDLAGVDYMDSSALGILLVLQKEAEEHGKTVALAHCKPFIRNILHTATFERLFAIF